MSPSRNDPNATGPGRPRRVAGLRKPGEEERPNPSPRPRTRPSSPADEQAASSPAAAGAAGQQETTREQEPAAEEAPAVADVSPEAEASPEAETAAHDGQSDSGPGEQAPTPEPVVAKQGPRGKPQSTGARKPTAQDELVETAAPGTPPEQVAGARGAGKRRGSLSRRGSYVLTALLLVLAAAFTTGAVYAKEQYQEIAEATENAALLDVSRTQEVKKAMMRAAEQLFSYDYRHIEKTQQAAKKLLASKEVQKTYGKLMSEIKRLAPKQKMVVNVTATEAAVLRLNDGRARVMVYVDQISTRMKTGQSVSGGAALLMQAELRSGKWKVVAMHAYNAGNPIESGPKKQQGAAKPSGKPSGSTSTGASSRPSGSAQPSTGGSGN